MECLAVPVVMHCIGTLNIALLLIYGTPFLGSLLGRLRQTHRNIKGQSSSLLCNCKNDAIYRLSWGLEEDFGVSKSGFLRSFCQYTVCFYELIDNNWRIKASKKWSTILQVENRITIPSSVHLEYPSLSRRCRQEQQECWEIRKQVCFMDEMKLSVPLKFFLARNKDGIL